MQTIVLQSHVDEDGAVDVRVPTEFAGQDVEVEVRVKPPSPSAESGSDRRYSTLDLLESLNLDGPVDGAERFHEILYGLPDDGTN